VKLLIDRRGSVALMTGIMAPVMVMSLAMGIEVTSWSVRKLELQRIADVAAWAGARQYVATNDVQSATQTAADLAEINGASGTSTREWNPTTLTTTDNSITAQVVGGVRNAADKAIKVTVKQSIAKSFSRIFPSTRSSVTVSAVAVAEIGSLGPQPCITALGGGADGITTGTDVNVGGTASLVATGCSLRANDGINQNGGGTINTSGVYAGGGISGSGICCDLHADSGQISDPYATNTPVQNALKTLSPGAGTAITVKSNTSQSIGPGTYSGWNVNGTLNLSPGLYIVNGDISSGGQSVISGSGVTIVTSGTVNTTGGSSLALTAPTTSPAGNAIPGILLAGNSSAAMAFLGNSTVPVTGVIYLPNASLKFGGTSSSGSDGCTEVIASTVTLVGTSNLAANCSAYGALDFGSLPASSSIALVQ
jgi:Flp pilus assembly protein TadG